MRRDEPQAWGFGVPPFSDVLAKLLKAHAIEVEIVSRESEEVGQAK